MWQFSTAQQNLGPKLQPYYIDTQRIQRNAFAAYILDLGSLAPTPTKLKENMCMNHP